MISDKKYQEIFQIGISDIMLGFKDPRKGKDMNEAANTYETTFTSVPSQKLSDKEIEALLARKSESAAADTAVAYVTEDDETEDKPTVH